MNNGWGAAVDWTRSQVEAGSLPAAVIGIGSSKGIEAIEAFGASGDRTAKTDDYFALFSMTKPMVGLAVMRAVSSGAVSLDATLDDALPTRAASLPGVTLEHLLTHRSGMSDVPLDTPLALREALLASVPDFAPGAMFRYTNLAFDGISAILEHSTGRTIEQHINEYLGSDAGITFDAAVNPHEVYGTEEAQLDIARMYELRHPAAGELGTAAGVLKLGARVLRSARDGATELIDPAVLADMVVPRTTGLGEPDPAAVRMSEYGLTWNLPDPPALRKEDVFGHAGWSGTQWWMNPQQDIVLVFLTNHLLAGDRGVDFSHLNPALVAG